MEDKSKVINQLIQRIVDIVHPLKIILFGSAARGDMTPNSDIDVLIVMPEGTHRRYTAQLLYRKLNGTGISFDIIVATSEDLIKYKDNIGLIYHTILEEGKEIYAA
jgi:predicted nucleotidyltransferase